MSTEQGALLAEVLSPSQISLFLNCPAKWMFRYLLDLKDPDTASTALGRAFHETIADNFRQKQEGLTVRNTLEISHVDEVLSCVREGLGLTVLLEEAIHNDEHLYRIPVADLSAPHEIGYYFLPGAGNALVESFIHLVQRTFIKPEGIHKK